MIQQSRKELWAKLLWLSACFLAGYPLANSGIFGGGSDCDEATIAGALSLVSGISPYHYHTYLNNPITPLPGALLLSVPMLQAQSIFWLALAPWYALLNPRCWHLTTIGSDYCANTIYVLLALIWFKRSRSVLAGICFGITLSSRLNFVFWLPFAYGRRIWIPVLVFAILTLPALGAIGHTAKIPVLAILMGFPLAFLAARSFPTLLGMSIVQLWFTLWSSSQLYSVFWWLPLCFWVRENEEVLLNLLFPEGVRWGVIQLKQIEEAIDTHGIIDRLSEVGRQTYYNLNHAHWKEIEELDRNIAQEVQKFCQRRKIWVIK